MLIQCIELYKSLIKGFGFGSYFRKANIKFLEIYSTKKIFIFYLNLKKMQLEFVAVFKERMAIGSLNLEVL